jgi:hypothetical protein
MLIDDDAERLGITLAHPSQEPPVEPQHVFIISALRDPPESL